ncbi:hypothetical protein AB2F57_14535 [Escherichia coli]
MTLLPYQVWRHAIGTPASQDKLIYEEKDDTYYVSLHKTTSKHYVVIHLVPAPPPVKFACWTRKWYRCRAVCFSASPQRSRIQP